MKRISAQLTLVIVPVFLSVVISGCNLFGFLATPGPYEKGVPAEYDLVKQQQRKILLWIECPRSSGADHDVESELATACRNYMIMKMDIKPENVLIADSVSQPDFLLDPKKIARTKGAGYVLLVQIDDYEMTPLQVKNYFYSAMSTRAILMDVDLGTVVWPKNNKAGKAVSLQVEMDTQGRDKLLTKMVSAAAHCTMRYLYTCPKVQFKSPIEQMTLQEAADMETY